MGQSRSTHIAGALLAAGASTRFGAPKQLLPWGHKALIEHALDVLLDSPVNDVIVVLGAHAEQIRPLVSRPQAEIVVNPDWREGLSTSVRAALGAMPSSAEAALFLPCDMPFVTPEHLAQMVKDWRKTGKAVVALTDGDRMGVPALFARDTFPRLLRIRGDQGGREVLRAYSDRALKIRVAPEILADIDTPEEYQRALARFTGEPSANSTNPHESQRARPDESRGPMLFADRSGQQRDPMHRLKSIGNLIVDMDGVLYRGDQAIPDVTTFFQFLREHGIRFLLATNNSTLTPQQYTEKLARMGVGIPPKAILTSSIATVEYLKSQYPPGTRIFAIGETGLLEAIRQSPFALDDKQAEVVVCGLDRKVTYDRFARATLLIRAGAQFVGTNPDKTLPVPEGEIPGTGSYLALLEAATGVRPFIIGKPEKHLYEIALKWLGAPKETTAALGDRLETDIVGAHRAGLFSILVLTGVSTRDEAESSPEPPDLIFDDVGRLAEGWRQVIESV